MELWGIGQIYMEFYGPLDLLELNLSDEELSRNVTWKWVIAQELNGCIGMEYEWNDSTLEFQFQSPDQYHPYQEGMRKPGSAEYGQKYSPATQIYLVD